MWGPWQGHWSPCEDSNWRGIKCPPNVNHQGTQQSTQCPPVYTSHHEKLLELLWTLGERIKASWLSGRNHKFFGSLKWGGTNIKGVWLKKTATVDSQFSRLLLLYKAQAYPGRPFKQGWSFHIHKTCRWAEGKQHKWLTGYFHIKQRYCECYDKFDGQSCAGIDVAKRRSHTYHAHYTGILSSSSPAQTSAWGSSACGGTSSPGSDIASAATQISVWPKWKPQPFRASGKQDTW